MKSLKIDAEKCTGCGTCLSFSEYIAEGSDGKARVKNNGKLEAQDVIAEAQEMVELCPEQAIALSDIQTKSLSSDEKKAVVDGLKKALGSIKIPGPTSSDYNFDKEKYSFEIDYGYLDGTHNYKYKSSSAAQDAGWKDFKRRNYARIEQYAMEVLSQYGTDKIAPFFDASEQGMYAKWNKQFETILRDTADRVANALGDSSLPDDFCTWNVLPTQYIDRFKDYNPIKWGAKVDKAMRSDSYTDESWYKRCVDTDDMEEEESGRFFSRTVTRYCYKYDKGLGKDFKKDIVDAIYLLDMNEYYEEVLSWIIDDYKSNIEKMIESKCKALEAALG
ncbi:ferredoxin [uncultured Megasphaera sp.]|uniref:ferredoxin n=1 Tax=uncultured Megasphaera sp. TaxID=165188 RepID=UPI0025F4BF0F|nr:ferredoxin [uncultured Megasphaera sp.]